MLFIFLAFGPEKTKAEWVDFDASGNAKEAISGLGVNMGTLDKYIKAFNVSDRKKQPPQVALTFDPVNPVPGQKVAAVAMPKYFTNDDRDLYFTWYLKSARCTDKETDKDDYKYNPDCDLDDSGEVDIEDYKIKAARIIANNDFEWNKDEAYDNHTDNDGYRAFWGGDDQKGKNKYCYIYDVESGNEQGIECDEHLFPKAPKITEDGEEKVFETGDGAFGKSEEEFWHTNPNDDDTADTGNGDEANIAGLGITSFSWNYEHGDKVGVVIEGISNEPTRTYDSSYMTMWAFVNNSCDNNYDYFEGTEIENSTVTYEYGDLIPDEGTVEGLPADVISYIEGKVQAKVDAEGEWIEVMIEKKTVTDFNKSVTTAYITTTYSVSYIAYSSNGEAGNKSKAKKFPQPTEEEDISGEAVKKSSDLNMCLYDNLIDPAEGGGQAQKLDINLAYTPEFPINNPEDDPEEGDVLDITSSVINAENPNYLRYKWEIFASNVPNPESWGTAISKGNLPEATQTMGVGLDSFSFRLNLTQDVLDASNPNADIDVNNFYLRAKLTVTENVPKNITEEDIGTSVKREGYGDVIIPISSTEQRIQVFNTEAADASGEVKLSVGSIERCTEGMEKTLCPITKNEIISLFVEEGDLTDFIWTVNGEPLTPLPSATPCLSGECEEEDGNIINTHIAYFPILEDMGFRYTVNLKAMNLDGEKVNLTRTFEVVEPEVRIMSADQTTCQPVLLGYYEDLDGIEWPDYSTTEFVALGTDNFDEGNIIKLQGLFSGFVPKEDQYSWIVDGAEINSQTASLFGYGYDTENNIVMLPPKEWKDFYDITLISLYNQDDLTEKALYTYWKVPYSQFYEKTLSANVEIKFTDFIDPATGIISKKNQSDKILASLLSSTPTYLAFLFRIVITSFLLLISSHIILSFFPEIKNSHS